jgi:hypothetical protein
LCPKQKSIITLAFGWGQKAGDLFMKKWLSTRPFFFAGLVVAGALILATQKMPYGYYQLLRFTVCIFSATVALLRFRSNSWVLAWVYVLIAVLFNPIAPIHFRRDTWAIIDVVTAALMFYASFYNIGKAAN